MTTIPKVGDIFYRVIVRESHTDYPEIAFDELEVVQVHEDRETFIADSDVFGIDCFFVCDEIGKELFRNKIDALLACHERHKMAALSHERVTSLTLHMANEMRAGK